MSRRLRLPTILSLALACTAAPAYGATTSSQGDPPAGSPAGSVYQLPFEQGRADGAPKSSGGTSAPGEEGGGKEPGGDPGEGDEGSDRSAGEEGPGETESSLYRSENNFGSSSQVPGSGGGASNGKDDGEGTTRGLADAELTDSGNTSSLANVGLLLLILAVVAGVAFVFVRARRADSES